MAQGLQGNQLTVVILQSIYMYQQGMMQRESSERSIQASKIDENRNTAVPHHGLIICISMMYLGGVNSQFKKIRQGKTRNYMEYHREFK